MSGIVNLAKHSQVQRQGGNFKESLVSDLPNMLALYEATHLKVLAYVIIKELELLIEAIERLI